MDIYTARTLCKLRTSNHKFPVETGRWYNVLKGNRLCPFCQNCIGDEYHYLFICKKFTEVRNKYVPEYFLKYPSHEKFHQLLSICNTKLLTRISIFVSLLFKEFN